MLPSFIFCQYLSDKNIPQPLLLQLFSYFLILSAIIGKECLFNSLYMRKNAGWFWQSAWRASDVHLEMTSHAVGFCIEGTCTVGHRLNHT